MSGRRKFDKAFKDQTVILIISEEATTGKITKKVDVYYTTVRNWVGQSKTELLSVIDYVL